MIHVGRAVEPDALLVERVAALSDKAALAELYARHGLSLYAVAYSMLFDPEAAEAAVGAAFRTAWRGAASFSVYAGSARLWLGDLTRRAARDHLRAGRRARSSSRPASIEAA
jgi:DNA-directed RNA polymerase specialized sigma24 family protein